MRTRISQGPFVGVAAAAAALALLAGPLPARGEGSERTRSTVHPTWDASVVLGESILVRTAGGVSASFRSSDLPAGHAVTMWFVVFNEPSACAGSPCGPGDLGVPEVKADFLWATGNVVGGSGRAGFGARLAVGDSSGSGFRELGAPEAAVGLLDPWGAEVHLLLHSHGPAFTGQSLKEQLTSFLGGCETFNGPGGIAAGPEDVPDAEGECSTFQASVHQ